MLLKRKPRQRNEVSTAQLWTCVLSACTQASKNTDHAALSQDPAEELSVTRLSPHPEVLLLITPFSLCITRVSSSELFPSHELWCWIEVHGAAWTDKTVLGYVLTHCCLQAFKICILVLTRGLPACSTCCRGCPAAAHLMMKWSLTHHHHFEALNVQSEAP